MFRLAPLKVTEYFSYEHFYVVFCRFYELDADRDGRLSGEDLMKYGEHGLSSLIVDRYGYIRYITSDFLSSLFSCRRRLMVDAFAPCMNDTCSHQGLALSRSVVLLPAIGFRLLCRYLECRMYSGVYPSRRTL